MNMNVIVQYEHLIHISRHWSMHVFTQKICISKGYVFYLPFIKRGGINIPLWNSILGFCFEATANNED